MTKELNKIDGFVPHSTSNIGRIHDVNGKRLSGQYRTFRIDSTVLTPTNGFYILKI